MQTTDYNQWLLPYLEGTLDARQIAEMEARLAADPSLAAEAERLRRTLDQLRQTASRAPAPLNAAPPADLWARLRSRLDAAPPPRRAAPPRLWWAAGASLAAASLILAGVVWLPGHGTPGADHKPMAAPGTLPVQIASRTTKVRETGEVPTPHTAVPTAPAVSSAPTAPPALSGPKVASASKSAPVTTMPTVPADPFALPKPPGTAAVNKIAPHASKPEQIASSGVGPKRDPEIAGSYYPVPPAPTVTPLPSTAPLVPPAAPMAAPPLAANSAMAARTAPPPLDAPVPAPAPAAPPKAMLKAQAPQRTNTSTSTVVTGDQAQSPSLGFGKPSAKTHTGADSYGAAPTPLTLDDWQASLAAAMRPPLWGENTGMQQANQALLNAQMAGRLNDLQAQLEARRGQSPSDIITRRMLAAVNEFGGSPAAALQVRRQTVTLNGADGEDWFLLAQSEERAGNGAAAKAAYQHALASPTPPPPFHAAIARQRSQ